MADYAIHDTTLIAQADIIRKKFGTSDSQDPAEYAEKMNLMGVLEEKTTSGAIASFDDGADDVPISSGVFNMDYTGDPNNNLHIYQTGKNLLDDTKHGIYGGGMYYSFNESAQTGVAIKYLPAGTYTFKPIFAAGVSALGIQIGITNPNTMIISDFSSPSSVTFTINEPKKNIYIQMFKTSNWQLSDVIGAQLEIGSTPTDYAAFVPVQRIDIFIFGSAAYGGYFNSKTGIFTKTKASDGSDLPEPIDVDCGAVTIKSLLGTNNIFCDTGDTEITYRSSGTITPVPIQPVLVSKTITENGVYSAEDDDADGYDVVTVNVSGGDVPFVPQFTETKIADNTAHAASFTLTEDYANFDMVKIVWYESASSSGFLYTTPDILDEIFSIGVGKLCINKPSTNYYACYTKSGLTWTRSNQRIIDVHEIYGVTFSNCTMQATDLYKRGASTTTKYAVSSQTSLKDFDLFMMASIHATDGSETMPTTWLYQYPKENMSEAFSCPVPTVLQEYNANDEAFVISEYGMTAARYFMVQGITFTPN